MDANIIFKGLNRGIWLRTIAEYTSLHRNLKPDELVRIDLIFQGIEEPTYFEPLHLVTLACLIEYLKRMRYDVWLSGMNSQQVNSFLYNTLKFGEYFSKGINYIETEEESILNLWRIVENEKESQTQKVHDYLRRRFFRSKDLSAVKNSLDEVYYNIFDHAEADGIAFSFIKFDKKKDRLHVAAYDLGNGIAATVRKAHPEILQDCDAIELAMQDRFTTNSRTHNKGMGLGNIRMTCTEDDYLRIVSNYGLLIANTEQIKPFENTFCLKGTLIYYDLSLDHFEDLEIIGTFEV